MRGHLEAWAISYLPSPAHALLEGTRALAVDVVADEAEAVADVVAHQARDLEREGEDGDPEEDAEQRGVRRHRRQLGQQRAAELQRQHLHELGEDDPEEGARPETGPALRLGQDPAEQPERAETSRTSISARRMSIWRSSSRPVTR